MVLSIQLAAEGPDHLLSPRTDPEDWQAATRDALEHQFGHVEVAGGAQLFLVSRQRPALSHRTAGWATPP